MTFDEWQNEQDEDRMEGVSTFALIRAWLRYEREQRVALDNSTINGEE